MSRGRCSAMRRQRAEPSRAPPSSTWASAIPGARNRSPYRMGGDWCGSSGLPPFPLEIDRPIRSPRRQSPPPPASAAARASPPSRSRATSCSRGCRDRSRRGETAVPGTLSEAVISARPRIFTRDEAGSAGTKRAVVGTKRARLRPCPHRRHPRAGAREERDQLRRLGQETVPGRETVPATESGKDGRRALISLRRIREPAPFPALPPARSSRTCGRRRRRAARCRRSAGRR